ncbi:hypothetical protein MsAg5_02690 [Methanosarcinaceae archaeon Ag5]|uniref:Right handed beta helix domain-containing protein n=1 Tax=Methanolapillus africanus TaxID=3028297 RepID=A0AAE4MII5_9EURY|nr:hypothetical protein [Methanosarcinaceae archaeon Ag5]
MIKRRLTPIIIFLLTLMALTGTAAALSGDGTSADTAYIVDDNSNLTAWEDVAQPNQFVKVTALDLLDEVLLSAQSDTTVLLTNGPYTATQYLILSSEEGITVTNDAGASPVIQLTGVTDGFKIQSNRTTIKNVTLDGTNTADYGFRVQIDYNTGLGGHNIIFDNVTATNMNKTAFDFSRNTNCSYTNLTAINNGAFGLTITQGNNVTVLNTVTQNNSWGGVNVNNKPQGDAYDMPTADIDISGIQSLEINPITLEEYNTSSASEIRSNTDVPSNIDLNNMSVVVSNSGPGGVEDDTTTPMSTKLVTLNINNTETQNGSVLSKLLEESVDGNEVNVPAGNFNVGNVTIPANITIVGSGNPTIIGILTPAPGIDPPVEEGVTVTPPPAGSGGGTGQATVVNTTQTNNTTTNNTTTNDTTTNNTTPPTNTSDTSNTSPNTTPNNTSTPSSESWWDQYMWYVIGAIIVILIVAAGAYYYFYVYKPKNS